MARKIIFLAIIILILFGGGIFYWWQNQAGVMELNKTLPKGIWVEKNLFGLGNEYRVVNKIDGYEFGVPREWGGINEIAYTPNRTQEKYVFTTIELEGREEMGRIVVINHFQENKADLILDDWVRTNFETFGLLGEFTKGKIGEFDIVKTQENIHLGGMYIYFFQKGQAIFSLTGGSEQFIKEIILNGKW